MEEDTIELIDYLRVIWKRKILIIAGTLVCMVAGGVWSLRLPMIYHAEVLIRIGKVYTGPVSSSSSSSSPPPLVLIDTSENLAKTIPIEYAIKEALEYDLNVEVDNGASLIEIVLKGPDKRKTKELLGKVVEKLIAVHHSRTESSILSFQALIEKRREDISEIQNELTQEALVLKEMSIDDMDMDKEMGVDIDKTDPFTLMMIQNNLKQGRHTIRVFQDQIFMHQLAINRLKENKTRLVGEVENTAIKPKKKRNIILAGIVGLMMSLFLAFFIEYLRNAREREGEKDLV